MLVVLATIALVVLPVAVVEWPREIARWHVAAADEQALNGDYVAAVTQLDRAIRWNDSDPQLYLQRARYKLEAGQWQSGLEDCDRARSLMPDDAARGGTPKPVPATPRSSSVRRWRSGGRSCKRGAVLCHSLRAHQLNGMAYAMAVGTLDLEQGLAAVEESLRMIANVPAILDPAGVLCFGRAVTAQG